MLRTERLSRVVHGKTIVNSISIDVQRGEVLAIVGTSGSGKSSFLRLLNRLDEPTEGTVFLDGEDYTTISPHLLRQRVGMVFQTPVPLPGSVADNMRFGPHQRGETVPDEVIETLLSQVGLEGYANRAADVLSGGEAQRMALVRTLANNPQVVLLDEVTSALDSVSIQRVEMLISTVIQQQQITCVMVTHNLEQAVRLAHRVMVIESGQAIRIGLPEEIIHADTTFP